MIDRVPRAATLSNVPKPPKRGTLTLMADRLHTGTDPPPGSLAFLSGGGQMGAHIREYAWEATPLGAPATWPQALRTSLRVLLTTNHPIFVFWGPEHICFYNDAYSQSIGPEKHPAILGARGRDAWDEIWHIIGPQIDQVMRGHGATWHENHLVPITRHGRREDVYWTYSYGPVDDERAPNGVGGVLVICTETTARVRAGRQMQFLLDLEQRLRQLSDPRSIMAVAAETLGAYLGAGRCGYADIDPEGGHFSVERDWTDGSMPSLAGRYRLDDFGREIIGEYRQGRVIRIDDSRTDPRTEGAAAAYAAIGDMRAGLGVPLLKDGQFVAAFYVHQKAPRRWLDEEVQATRDVAERTWGALERARAEERLRASNDELRLITDAMPVLMSFVDSTERYRYVNRVYEEWFGLAPQAVIGRTLREVLGDEARAALDTHIRRALAGERVSFETVVPYRDGGRRHVEGEYIPVQRTPGAVDGFYVFGQDVTHRQQAKEIEAALRESDARFRILADSAPVILWVTDPEARIEFVNRGYAEFFGTTPEETKRDGWQPLVHTDDTVQYTEAFIRAVRERAPFHATARLKRRDGTWRHVVSHALPRISDTGAFLGHVGASQDLTDLLTAQEALRAADRRKDEFLAMLAHELRNPLAPIRTAAQVLKLSMSGEPQAMRTSEIIVRQVEHMTEIVEDLLDVSRVTRGLVELHLEPVDVKQAVAAAIEQCRPAMESRRQRLTLDAPPERLEVNGDAVRLVQIVSNLLSNAVKYTPEDGSIELTVEADTDLVRLRVRDTGSGIPADLLPHIFELFTQADRTAARTQGGLGLGLALVKRLVELHGGTVDARSDGPGRGAEFTVRLPRLTVPTERMAAAVTAAQPVGASGNRLRLLVVDDNKDAADMLAALLEMEGHEVSVEHDARAALARARAEKPPVMLLDIGLPVMDGYELARHLREDPGTASAVLIALTGYGREEDQQQSRDAGFDHHLVKPVDPAQLSALLESLSASFASNKATLPTR